MEDIIFSVGSRVRIISYSPFRGLKGTVKIVDTIPQSEEPFCFYRIELDGSHIKEPIWFERDEVELVDAIHSSEYTSLGQAR